RVVGDKDSGDAEQPGPRRAAARPVTTGRVDRGDEDLRGQVSRPLPLPDPPGHEPLHRLDVLEVERLEEIGVAPDPAQLLSSDAPLAGDDEPHMTAERTRRVVQRSLAFHAPSWLRGGKALRVGVAPTSQRTFACASLIPRKQP